jgi:plasmid maintenance system antidote protein VapI
MGYIERRTRERLARKLEADQAAFYEQHPMTGIVRLHVLNDDLELPELAKACGVSHSTLRRFAVDTGRINSDGLDQLARFFGLGYETKSKS